MSMKSYEEIREEYYKQNGELTPEEAAKPAFPDVEGMENMTIAEFDEQMIHDEWRQQFGPSFVLSKKGEENFFGDHLSLRSALEAAEVAASRWTEKDVF